MKKVAIGTPFIRSFFGDYVISLVSTLLASKASGYAIEFIPLGDCGYIHIARNKIAEKFLQSPFKGDYLLFIDYDMVWGTDAIPALIEADKDIIGGLYCYRHQDLTPVVCKYNSDHNLVNITEIPNEPFLCDTIGTGFLMIKRHVIEALMGDKESLPFDFLRMGREPIGEDYSFCIKARWAGFEVWCHPGFLLGHIGKMTFDIEMFKALKAEGIISSPTGSLEKPWLDLH